MAVTVTNIDVADRRKHEFRDSAERKFETLLVIRHKMRKLKIVTEPCSDIWIIRVGQCILFMFQLKVHGFLVSFFSVVIKK